MFCGSGEVEDPVELRAENGGSGAACPSDRYRENVQTSGSDALNAASGSGVKMAGSLCWYDYMRGSSRCRLGMELWGVGCR